MIGATYVMVCGFVISGLAACHPGEGRGPMPEPSPSGSRVRNILQFQWIPAFAGMTSFFVETHHD
jgi:hypothetical protein